MSTHCNPAGEQEPNLSQAQAEGLNSLAKRLKRDDLVVMETDKSSRLSVQTLTSYVESTLPHTMNDNPVSQEDLAQAERTLNGHTLQLSRALQLCQAKSEARRLKMALTNQKIEARPIKAVRKDHKVVPPGQELVGPPSRPIGDGNNAVDSQLNSILAEICAKAADRINDPSECHSTEGLLHHIDLDNMDPDRPGGQTIFSLDVKAMYPSMERESTA